MLLGVGGCVCWGVDDARGGIYTLEGRSDNI